jgi:hypothetical protein
MPYVVDGLTHRSHEFTKPAVVGGASYQIPVQGGGANINWEDAVDVYAAFLSFIMATATTPGVATLEQKVSGSWLVKSSHTPAFSNAAGTYIKATQLTIAMKDTGNNIMKTIQLEGPFDLPRHWASFSAVPSGAIKDALTGFDSTNTGATNPYKWMVSGQELHLRSSPIVGVTTTLNRRVRRSRGLV